MVSSELIAINEGNAILKEVLKVLKEMRDGNSNDDSSKWLKASEFMKKFDIGRTRLARLIKEGSVLEKDYGCGYKFLRFANEQGE